MSEYNLSLRHFLQIVLKRKVALTFNICLFCVFTGVTHSRVFGCHSLITLHITVYCLIQLQRLKQQNTHNIPNSFVSTYAVYIKFYKCSL
jgi:hypothetical protein